MHYLNNDTLLSINTYYRYYNEKKLIDWIINLSEITNDNTKKILDGNIKINSFLESIYNKYDMTSNMIGFSNNEIIIKLSELNNNKFKLFNDNILINDILYYDYIFLDFPTGIHNMIHASCCKKIKNLKIRGTKVDALLLQLVMTSLNKNGKSLLIVPDSILYGDSIQQVQTRKYLFENFNIKNIIQLDEKFYKIKGTKNSILYFINDFKTREIIFSKLSIELNLENIITIDYNKIVSQNYSFFYKHYIDNTNYELIYIPISDCCNITDNYLNINDKSSNNILSINIYYKDDISIIFGLNEKYNLFISSPNLYILYYVYTLINTNINLYTSGKLLKFDIDKIKAIKIPKLSEKQENTINNYITISNNIILQNNNKIEMYIKLQTCLFDTLPNPSILLLDIVNITNSLEDNLIGIIKNGLTAGYIYYNNDKINNNSYYLKLINTNYNIKFIYYYLKYIEPQIQSQCCLLKQPLLTLGYLGTIKLPNINIDIQNEIVNQCDELQDNIHKYINDNLNIKNKNIINIILKIY
jgi:hypothetical protein